MANQIFPAIGGGMVGCMVTAFILWLCGVPLPSPLVLAVIVLASSALVLALRERVIVKLKVKDHKE